MSKIPTDRMLVLAPAQNGGWTIQDNPDRGLMPALVAAFTTPQDMIKALDAAFAAKEPRA